MKTSNLLNPEKHIKYSSICKTRVTQAVENFTFLQLSLRSQSVLCLQRNSLRDHRGMVKAFINLRNR